MDIKKQIEEETSKFQEAMSNAQVAKESLSRVYMSMVADLLHIDGVRVLRLTGIEQSGVDAPFCTNTANVYSLSKNQDSESAPAICSMYNIDVAYPSVLTKWVPMYERESIGKTLVIRDTDGVSSYYLGLQNAHKILVEGAN